MPSELNNSPLIEIRFIENTNKRTIFYFNGVFLQDSLFFGEMPRFLRVSKGISLSNVKLIEDQDGNKNFRYMESWWVEYPVALTTFCRGN